MVSYKLHVHLHDFAVCVQDSTAKRHRKPLRPCRLIHMMRLCATIIASVLGGLAEQPFFAAFLVFHFWPEVSDSGRHHCIAYLRHWAGCWRRRLI